MKRWMLPLAAALLVAAKTEGPLWPDDLERTPPLTTYMTYKLSMHDADPVVDELSRALVQDEARVLSWTADNACFRVSMQTAATVEEYSGDWEYKVNGERVWPEDAEVAIYDYPFTGERTVVDAAGITPLGNYASFKLTKPEERVFRVIHRTSTVCGKGLSGKGKKQVVRVDALLKGTPGMAEESRVSSFVWLPQG